MKLLTTTALCVITGAAVHAGGIDRSGQSIGIIFEEGNYAEFSLGVVNPSVSGVYLGTTSSGDMADTYNVPRAAYKMSVNENIDFALIYDTPFGANVTYPTSTYPFVGTTADLSASAITGILKYKMDNLSVYGGLRYQTMQGTATILPFTTMPPLPGPLNYNLSAPANSATGYLVGAAYEKPEIALRVALTYNSKIKHTLSSTESSIAYSSATVDVDTETPQSLNLDFQSGVAADTLVFGSIRWVEWSAFDYTPPGYATAPGGSLLSYDNDVFTYTLGVGRKLNENWSAAVSLGYEKAQGGLATNLAPTDGYFSVGLGGSYTKDNMKISAGVRYIKPGDATTETIRAVFTDNSAIAYGLKVGFTF